jgi:hypothetical protein
VIADDDDGTRTAELQRDCASDSARAAGYERRFAFE